MSNKAKRFISSFICKVDIESDKIVLEDSSHNQYYIDRSKASIETIENFKLWFAEVYMKAIPATMTIVDYTIGENVDGESIMVVNHLVSPAMAPKQASPEEA